MKERTFQPRTLIPMLAVGAVVALLFSGCIEEDDFDDRTTEHGAAHAGPWDIPTAVVQAGNQQYVAYDDAGAWNGGSSCSGGLEPGHRSCGTISWPTSRRSASSVATTAGRTRPI